jgi:hypothetical protein
MRVLALAHGPQVQALALLRTVYNVTDRPIQWRSLEGLDVPETAEALPPLACRRSTPNYRAVTAKVDQ